MKAIIESGGKFLLCHMPQNGSSLPPELPIRLPKGWSLGGLSFEKHVQMSYSVWKNIVV
jgi:hypothetical protein